MSSQSDIFLDIVSNQSYLFDEGGGLVRNRWLACLGWAPALVGAMGCYCLRSAYDRSSFAALEKAEKTQSGLRLAFTRGTPVRQSLSTDDRPYGRPGLLGNQINREGG